MEPITSIDTIARQASAAAAQWKPGQDRPENPYDAIVMPAQHREWQRRFEIALLRASVKEAA
jgi:hypothetical protein